MRSSLFWDVTQRISVVRCRRFGTTYLAPLSSVKQTLTLENGLSRNVGSELSIYVAWHLRRARSHLYPGGSLKWLIVVIFLTRVLNTKYCRQWAFQLIRKIISALLPYLRGPTELIRLLCDNPTGKRNLLIPNTI